MLRLENYIGTLKDLKLFSLEDWEVTWLQHVNILKGEITFGSALLSIRERHMTSKHRTRQMPRRNCECCFKSIVLIIAKRNTYYGKKVDSPYLMSWNQSWMAFQKLCFSQLQYRGSAEGYLKWSSLCSANNYCLFCFKIPHLKLISANTHHNINYTENIYICVSFPWSFSL